MRKVVVTVVLSLLSYVGLSQSVLFFRADTVKILKNGGTAELMLLNTTKDTLGLAMNAGGGRILFKRPYILNDSTLVIAGDTLTLRGGSTLSVDDINAAISAAVSALNLSFDSDLMEGDGSGGGPYRPDTTLYIETRWHSQYLIDSIGAVINALVFTAGGKTTLQNVGTGDTLAVKVNDSLWSIKSLKEGSGIDISVTGTEITITATAGGTDEINTITATASAVTNLTISAEAMLMYVLVKPASALTGFKIGTLSDDDKFFPATPVASTTDFTVFDVGAYIGSSTAVYLDGFSGISTELKIVFKLIHE